MAEKIGSQNFAYEEDIKDGLESAPMSLANVLTGANFGKSLIRVAADA